MFFPVAMLLAGMGIVGFIYAKNSLSTQWAEAANLKSQRAVHQVDMFLGRAKEWLKMFHTADGNPDADYIHELVIQQLREVDGVARVDLTWTDYRHWYGRNLGNRKPPMLKNLVNFDYTKLSGSTVNSQRRKF